MRNFQVGTLVHASPERIWSVLADIEHWAQWTASIKQIEPLSPPPLGVGSRARVEQPKLPPAIWEITAWEPARRFTWQNKRPGLAVIGDHLLQGADGGCTVTLTVHFEGALGGLFGWLNRRLTQQYLHFESEGLKARAEGQR